MRLPIVAKSVRVSPHKCAQVSSVLLLIRSSRL